MRAIIQRVTIDGAAKKYSFKELLDWAGGFTELLKKNEFKDFCYANGWIPFSTLKERSELENWLEDLGSYMSGKAKSFGDIKDKKAKIRDIFNAWLGFKIPSLTLENKPFYEVAEIFERINRTGVELSVFALATAVFFKQGINLRDWWKEYYSSAENEVIDFCDEDDEEYPKIVLQIMALRQTPKPLEVKKRVLVNSKVFKVEKDNWVFSCSLLDKSLQRLQNTTTGYGVIRPELLPYRTIVAPMSGLIEFSKTADDFNKLDAWYWSSIFTERCAGASDTAIKQDFDQVKNWFEDTTKIPEAVKAAENRITDIDLLNTSKGAVPKAVMNLIALKGALDFYTGQSIDLCKLNDHHIFPKKSGITLTNENSILNRTLIQDSTNNEIRKKKPSEYVEAARQKLGSEQRLKEVMSTHFIEESALQALKNDDYAGYLKAREAAILQEILSKIKLNATNIVPTT